MLKCGFANWSVEKVPEREGTGRGWGGRASRPSVHCPPLTLPKLRAKSGPRMTNCLRDLVHLLVLGEQAPPKLWKSTSKYSVRRTGGQATQTEKDGRNQRDKQDLFLLS